MLLHDLPDFLVCLNEPDQLAILGAPHCTVASTKRP